MVDAPFDYETITSLYNSSGVLQNKSTYTPFTRDKILRLRDDIDTQGETLAQTGANWTANNYDWIKGDRYNLDTDKRLWMSYISDLRSACEDLASTAGLSAPTWTVATLVPLYKRGKTATISGTVLTQTGADFTDVTTTNDYCYIQSGTGATIGRYQITAKTTTTLTLSGYSGDSGTGDVVYDVLMTGKKATYTTANLKSLITDIQTAILAVQDATGTFRYFVDSVSGSDANPGTRTSPYATWNKAVTQCNSTAGNIFFFPGAYTVDLAITQANTTIQGESTDSVVMDIPASGGTHPSNANGFVARDLYWGDGTTQGIFAVGITGLLLERCVFRAPDQSGSAGFGLRISTSSGSIKHSSFWGKSTDTGLSTAYTGATVVVDNSHFINLSVGAHSLESSTGSATFNYCTFEDVATKTTGGGTFTHNNEHTTTTDNIAVFETMYLFDTSDLIGAANDGFDIGAYPQEPYNVIRTATDSIGVTESSEMSLFEPAADSINADEDLASITMNLSVDMPFWGLFESDSDGDVIYLTNALITAAPRKDLMVTSLSNFQYNGASLDMSWDNAAGDLFEVHIVSSDGVTDYTPVAWWENNALFPAASTTDINGTRGYALDCFLESELDEEWGNQGAFSATTPTDGVNDQKWDITLKIRVKNTISGDWSELITLSKTYNFNTFAGTMAYHADNPRVVDNEYADHANYMLNDYHTTDGSDKLKYTRPDGADFAVDNRRYAYTPAFKGLHHTITISAPTGGGHAKNIYSLWQDRETATGDTIGAADARATKAIYPCIWANYGNWNNGGGHCFATTFNDVYDGGTYNSATPILGSATNKIRYLYLQAYLGSDCFAHSSFNSFYYYMPSGELMSHSSFGVGDHINENSDLIYILTTAGGCNGDRFYLQELNDAAAWGDRNYWWVNMGEIRVNESINGQLTWNALHNGDIF